MKSLSYYKISEVHKRLMARGISSDHKSLPLSQLSFEIELSGDLVVCNLKVMGASSYFKA